MKKTNRLSLLFVIVLIFSLAGGCQTAIDPWAGEDSGEESQSADTKFEDAKAGQVYEVGNIIHAGDSILVVLGWDYYPGGTQFPPEVGYVHLAVDLMLANQGKEPFEFSPGHSMTIKDPGENIYYMNSFSGYVSGSVSPDAELVPGEIIRGNVGFQVPEDQVDLVLIFETDLDDLGDISVNLGPTPTFLAPPTDLNLKFKQDIFHIGDSVEFLDLLVQVIEVSYPADDEITRPEEGHKSLVIELRVENQGDGTLYFIGTDQIYLKDSTGQKYHDDSLALPSGADDHVVGSLEPGEHIRGRIAFLVPEDGTGFTFVFDRDMFDYGKLFISVD